MAPAPNRPASASASPITVLWTGGLDSSFRIIDLVLRLEETVQPYYVLDEERKGTGYEINAMLRIRRAIATHHPEAAARLLPTRYQERRSIRPNDRAEARFALLAKRRSLGTQYQWLAYLAAAEELDALELSVHQDDRVFPFLDGYVSEVLDVPGKRYMLRSDLNDDALELFRPFRFPLLDWNKPAMYQHAEAHRFADLMDMTWFCHSPRRGQPCGRCDPCGFAMVEGMAHRLPARSRVMYHLVQLKRKLRRR